MVRASHVGAALLFGPLVACGQPDVPTVAVQAARPPPAAVDQATLAKPVLSPDDLRRVVDEMQAYRPADPFAAPFDASGLEGKRFAIEIHSYGIFPAGALSSRYDHERHVLTVTPMVSWPTPGGNRDVVFDGQQYATGAHAAQNAFGATAVVKDSVRRLYIVTERKVFEPGHTLVGDPAAYEISLPPDAARQASDAVTLRYTGLIHRWASRDLITCEADVSQPTVQSPVAVNSQICFVSVVLDPPTVTGLPAGAAVRKIMSPAY